MVVRRAVVVLALCAGCSSDHPAKTRLSADRTSTTPSTETTTTTVAPAAGGPALEPGAEASGPGGLGASRTVAQDDMRVTLDLNPREGSSATATATVAGSRAPTSIRFDYGDGTRRTVAGPGCASWTGPQTFAPNPPAKSYAKAGEYTVTAAVTMVDCATGEQFGLSTSLTFRRP